MKTLISIKIDKNLKEEAQRVAGELGFSMSSLVNAFLRQLIREKTVFFTTTSRKMSETLERTLEKVEKDIAGNKNLSPKFSSAEQAVDYLKSL